MNKCGCGCEEVVWEDTGIGIYEYWGSRGCDTRMEPFCANCGEPILTSLSYEEMKKQREKDDY
jgi:hypothetical protein